jgi:triacylglycerol lipase
VSAIKTEDEKDLTGQNDGGQQEEPMESTPQTNADMDTLEHIQLPEEYLLTPAAASIPAGKKKMTKKTIAVIAAVCIIIAAIIPYPLGLYNKALGLIVEEPVQYPYILVHGLGGWGPESGINEKAPYWGATTGSLSQYLNGQGYTVVEASVGPFSSTWDRACELYAQLMGTTVDYGEAHAQANNHARYGRTYDKPLFEGWGTATAAGQIKKINLISHSFGGPTIRLLTSLLANGAQEEIEAGGDAVSPLFKGGQGDLVNSVTTLDSPNNGSTLFLALDQYNLVSPLLDVVLYFAGISGNTPVKGYLDFHLEQFGITAAPGEETGIASMKESLEKVLSTGNDNAVYDLSPDGCAELNKRIGVVEGVYYFSYSYSTTKENPLTGNHLPELDTLLVLMPTALLMGSYDENTASDFKIDKTWLPNDGLVNVVSARYPFGDPWQDYNSEDVKSGIWNVMPTRNGDHGTVIGLNAGVEETHSFYNDLFTMTDALPREKKYFFKSPF